MKILRNEKGFALGFVLILAVVALGMTLAMLFMLGRGSYVSGQQRRFHTAVEASRGGMEAMLQLIGSRGIPSTPYTNLFLNPSGASTFLQKKLVAPTDNWVSLGLNSAIAIDPADNTTYDVRLDLGTYRAYGKIVHTVKGNSAPDEGLQRGGVASENTGGEVKSYPYLYTVEVLAQSATNPTERSKISVLYQY
jgi:hypothetical protein